MNTRTFLFLGLFLLSMPLCAAYGKEEIPGAIPSAGPASYRSVNATVLKVASGMVFFKTEEKTVRNISMKEIDRNGIHSVKPGDRISLTVDRGNMILAVSRLGESTPSPENAAGTVQVSYPLSEMMFGAIPSAGPASYRSVNATVLKVASGMVFFKTEEKTVRNISMKEIDRNGIHSVKPGDRINLTVDRGNMILAVTRPGDGEFLAGEITGTVQAFDRLSKWITVEAAGKSRSFELKDAAATKLASLLEGKITLVLDRRNWVMDAYRSE